MQAILAEYKTEGKIFTCPGNAVKTETGKSVVYEYAKWLIQLASSHLCTVSER